MVHIHEHVHGHVPVHVHIREHGTAREHEMDITSFRETGKLAISWS
jgi:hypothetical protein